MDNNKFDLSPPLRISEEDHSGSSSVHYQRNSNRGSHRLRDREQRDPDGFKIQQEIQIEEEKTTHLNGQTSTKKTTKQHIKIWGADNKNMPSVGEITVPNQGGNTHHFEPAADRMMAPSRGVGSLLGQGISPRTVRSGSAQLPAPFSREKLLEKLKKNQEVVRQREASLNEAGMDHIEEEHEELPSSARGKSKSSKVVAHTPAEQLRPDFALPQLPQTRKATDFIANWNIEEPELAKEQRGSARSGFGGYNISAAQQPNLFSGQKNIAPSELSVEYSPQVRRQVSQRSKSSRVLMPNGERGSASGTANRSRTLERAFRPDEAATTGIPIGETVDNGLLNFQRRQLCIAGNSPRSTPYQNDSFSRPLIEGPNIDANNIMSNNSQLSHNQSVVANKRTPGMADPERGEKPLDRNDKFELAGSFNEKANKPEQATEPKKQSILSNSRLKNRKPQNKRPLVPHITGQKNLSESSEDYSQEKTKSDEKKIKKTLFQGLASMFNSKKKEDDDDSSKDSAVKIGEKRSSNGSGQIFESLALSIKEKFSSIAYGKKASPNDDIDILSDDEFLNQGDEEIKVKTGSKFRNLKEILKQGIIEEHKKAVVFQNNKSLSSSESLSSSLEDDNEENKKVKKMLKSLKIENTTKPEKEEVHEEVRDIMKMVSLDPNSAKRQSEKSEEGFDFTLKRQWSKTGDETATKKFRDMSAEEQDSYVFYKLKMIRINNPLRVRWDLLVMILSIWVSLEVPVEIAFQPPQLETVAMTVMHYIIDSIYFFDIMVNFRTTFYHELTGDEVMTSKDIAKNYVLQGRFFLDILSTIPFDLIMKWVVDDAEFSQSFQLFRMLKLFRILRLSRIITYMNSTDDVKLSLRLFKLCLFLILYIHCTACLLFLISTYAQEMGHEDENHQTWRPAQFSYYDHDVSLLNSDFHVQYIVSFYNSILAMTGNEIYPCNFLQFVVASILLISGALINANIFGTIAVIAQTFNRKAQRFQEQIDVANTSMKNMKLPSILQNNVREFMMSTQNNLDNQKELDQFLNMISPSLRLQVTQHIFQNAIIKNSIFSDNQDLIDFLINDITTLLYLPEDTIIQQNQNGENLFLIAKGDCEVWVKDHLKNNRYVRQLFQGEYFGELSLLTQQPRSATVKSSNYCTMASLSKDIFYDLCNSFPDIFLKMKKRAMEYQDPWKQFKKTLLEQIDYFNAQYLDEEFFEEVHYFMKEEFIERGTQIMGIGESCNAIIFIVQGMVDLKIFDQEGNEYILETLQQGDMIGQYSVLFNEEFLFTVTAQSNVRLLTLDQKFFMEQKDMIEGMEDALFEAEEFVHSYGIPICDFKIFQRQTPTLEKFQNAVKRVKKLNNLHNQSKQKFFNLIQKIRSKVKEEKADKKKKLKKKKAAKTMTSESKANSDLKRLKLKKKLKSQVQNSDEIPPPLADDQETKLSLVNHPTSICKKRDTKSSRSDISFKKKLSRQSKLIGDLNRQVHHLKSELQKKSVTTIDQQPTIEIQNIGNNLELSSLSSEDCRREAKTSDIMSKTFSTKNRPSLINKISPGPGKSRSSKVVSPASSISRRQMSGQIIFGDLQSRPEDKTPTTVKAKKKLSAMSGFSELVDTKRAGQPPQVSPSGGGHSKDQMTRGGGITMKQAIKNKTKGPARDRPAKEKMTPVKDKGKARQHLPSPRDREVVVVGEKKGGLPILACVRNTSPRGGSAALNSWKTDRKRLQQAQASGPSPPPSSGLVKLKALAKSTHKDKDSADHSFSPQKESDQPYSPNTDLNLRGVIDPPQGSHLREAILKDRSNDLQIDQQSASSSRVPSRRALSGQIPSGRDRPPDRPLDNYYDQGNPEFIFNPPQEEVKTISEEKSRSSKSESEEQTSSSPSDSDSSSSDSDSSSSEGSEHRDTLAQLKVNQPRFDITRRVRRGTIFGQKPGLQAKSRWLVRKKTQNLKGKLGS